MIAWGSTTDRILLLLEQEPMTKAEICRLLGLTHDQVASVLSRLNKRGKKTPKRIYISGHTRHTTSGRTYIRAMYSVGNEPNKKCRIKAFTVKERAKRTYDKLIALRNNSIFNQTATRRELTEQRKSHD